MDGMIELLSGMAVGGKGSAGGAGTGKSACATVC
jgi:hypothetical protein